MVVHCVYFNFARVRQSHTEMSLFFSSIIYFPYFFFHFIFCIDCMLCFQWQRARHTKILRIIHTLVVPFDCEWKIKAAVSIQFANSFCFFVFLFYWQPEAGRRCTEPQTHTPRAWPITQDVFMYTAVEWVSGIISFFTGDGTQEIWIFEGRSGSLDRSRTEVYAQQSNNKRCTCCISATLHWHWTIFSFHTQRVSYFNKVFVSYANVKVQHRIGQERKQLINDVMFSK